MDVFRRTMNQASVPVEARCEQRWTDLRGAGARRHCEVCDAPVTNLSLLTEEAARAVLAEGPQCIAYRHRPDGTIVFAESLKRRRGLAVAAVAVLAAACSAEPSAPPDALAEKVETLKAPHPALVETCRRLLGSERRAENARELQEEQSRVDCDLARQMFALGGYGATLPPECE